MIKLYRFLDKFTAQITAIVILIFFQVIANLYLPTLSSDIIDKGIANNDLNYIFKIGGLMILVSAGGVICSVVAGFLSSRTAVELGMIIRSKIFAKVEGFSLHEFDKIGTATLITRTTNDVTQIQQVTVMMFSIMLFAPLTGIGGIIMALREDKPLTWIFAVVIPLLTIIIGMVLQKGIPLFKLMQVKLDKLNLVLREGLTGIRVIRAFNRIENEKERFDAANLGLMNNSIKVNKIMAVLMPIMMLIMNLTTVAIFWFGSMRIDAGSMQVGSLMAFIQYGMQILFSFLMIAMMFIMIPRAQASAERINEVLEMEPEIVDLEKTSLANKKSGYVEFKEVTFSYPGAEQPAISNITFSAEPGEVTAIIGGTGSGKSTLINLIPRFYDATSGCVLVNGVDVREISQEDLRVKIGFVPQKNVLFSGTIADNIKYGNNNATFDEIKHAAQVAQATDFINGMDMGFDHFIAQGGTNVSGGQKQRLSIARALVRKPEIYIFDDSFSALDFKTDARLRAALKDETAVATVLIIAQRVATVMDADRIIVLDEGKIAGMGIHKELLTSCKVYHEIVSSQLSEEELE
ncbi:ABC transporter ATP-binding protein/permease [Clostridium tagluense]|uniref:ABC transporter ATP-binding protein n=1 Tax=Clostridium tagluense TaxID=360422 RepID=UPI001CF190FA|nr:ABC transporter ATP-binding protein [Clostridium tagluense]MCB2312056.1 ABC transporter ATP-binding protein/permease [Clostridium tagluense]MCB2316643.1 ABC transporter ATP-binding protein/permease [Clostridium tagluense]MCB2321421.1 ABC transporter ATP-binding protein/permease [Clostridium tagluense]MCB2326433.1 ABC transporter ATP-binding protein/permease [Clostridium tagluense]MCB2331235.1 ABC transporter ATP-binding protein/permease [Clostridium tagluense]